MKRPRNSRTASNHDAAHAPRRLTLNPKVIASHDVSGEALALATWYDAHPMVRRLWGVRSGRQLRVFLILEPTPDGDDQLPVWLGNARSWAGELQERIGSTVQLELVPESRVQAVEIDPVSTIVADLYWRDATLA